jgi:hypothetical protein
MSWPLKGAEVTPHPASSLAHLLPTGEGTSAMRFRPSASAIKTKKSFPLQGERVSRCIGTGEGSFPNVQKAAPLTCLEGCHAGGGI